MSHGTGIPLPTTPLNYDSTGALHVVATKVDLIHIYYECSFCYNSYKKDGTPTLRAKHRIHFHGSGGDLSNREEGRGSHCPAHKDHVIIHITDETEKVNKKP